MREHVRNIIPETHLGEMIGSRAAHFYDGHHRIPFAFAVVIQHFCRHLVQLAVLVAAMWPVFLVLSPPEFNLSVKLGKKKLSSGERKVRLA
jgi:hypothetical protein